MGVDQTRRAPGEVRDLIVAFLKRRGAGGATVAEVVTQVRAQLEGEVAASSVRSYLQLGRGIERVARGRYRWVGSGR